MPPEEKLPAAVIADFERWVAEGAHDPRDHPPTADEAAGLAWRGIFDARREWWSLKPVSESELPAADTESPSSTHPVDRFIEARLAAAGLELNSPAKPRTLLRRLSLVLTGLPPTPEETHAFEQQSDRHPDSSQDAAYTDLVDRLLESPHFGERWARHWMDV
ncbi:MAG: hypothetical protein CMJ62_18510, partial [Planctomycetaceae bacterium]|nr:hypothetical protein [Planctomycetaceae bacterium]